MLTYIVRAAQSGTLLHCASLYLSLNLGRRAAMNRRAVADHDSCTLH